jgi:hypothetical protein
MNTFNYFIIGILLLSTQALAIRPIATKLERISVDTFRLTMDQPVQLSLSIATNTAVSFHSH